jgi:flagellin
MANDVVLSASMRSNLLSLQNTQRSIDSTQLRLATGKKVNSALDNPQSFFTSQSLSNRAGDLSRLLDGIGQAIRTIEEADKGITALARMIEQADSIVGSARDALASSDGEARMTGTIDLSDVDDLLAETGATAGDTFTITTVDDAGVQISEDFTLQAVSASSLAATITNTFKDDHGGEVSARINEATGFLELSSTAGRTFKISGSTANAVDAATWDALGIGRYFETENRGTDTFVSATIIGGNTVKTISMYEAAGNLVDAGDAIAGSTLTNSDGITVLANVDAADTLQFTINNDTGKQSAAIALSGSWQDLVDSINLNDDLNQLIKANFNTATGQMEITSLSDTVESVDVNFNGAAAAADRVFNIGWGDTSGNLDPLDAATAGANRTILSFNTSTQALDSFAKDFNSIRDQINDLVKDAQYRGVNLLNGDDLVTFFNEDNSSQLRTEGATFTADGLGLVVANFRSSEAVENMSTLVKSALNEVRSFGSSLANNLSIIQTRRTFTEETIVTLKAGSADLVNADDNEEGANLLALQTRQQLGVTSLSLASQSQQSVLRLF